VKAAAHTTAPEL